MNGKMRAEGSSPDDRRADILNPFVHKLELENTYDKIKTAVFTVILLPFRVVVICGLVVAAWLLACVGLHGLSQEQLRTKPMTGWRRALRPVICTIGKLSYLAGGMAIVVRGRQASKQEAPILVVAPHSSFLDSCIVYATKMSSVIVRYESMDNYVGKLINYTQPVYVWRDDPNSRQNSIKEIIERATSKEDWPQVLIFPEGTCTNRSCLITFKPGGFYPGVPVQPVTIRYPNALDTVTWTWEGPGALKLLWLTLTQVHSSCEIEFLPVYYPNEDERKDPKLYARNVRDVMAKALGVPVLDYTYDDCRLLTRAKHLGIPASTNIVEVQKLRVALGLEKAQLEVRLAEAGARGGGRWVARPEFSQRLGLGALDPDADRLYNIFLQGALGDARVCAQKQCELVCWPDYLLCAVFLSLQHSSVAHLLRYAFKIYDSSGTGRLSAANFEEVAMKSLGLFQEDANHAFRQADLQEKGHITYDEFIAFAQKKAEFCFIFNAESVHPKKSQ